VEQQPLSSKVGLVEAVVTAARPVAAVEASEVPPSILSAVPELEEVGMDAVTRAPLRPLSIPAHPGSRVRSPGLEEGLAADRISAVTDKEIIELTGLAETAIGSGMIDADASSFAQQASHHFAAPGASCCSSTNGGCGSPAPCGCGSSGGCGCQPICGGGSCMQCESTLGGRCGQCGSLCGCDCCRSRFWGRFDALFWFTDGFNTPALITQSPAGTAPTAAGLLGQPTTQVLGGNQVFGDGFRAGGRVQTGWWFDECRRVGLQGDFFALDGGGGTTVFNSGPNGTFARPFTNTETGQQDAQIFGQPGLSEGSVAFTNSSNIISAAPSLRFNICCCESTDCCNPGSTRTDFLLGYRFFRLEEQFASREVLNVTDPLFVDGTMFELTDSIRTQNTFHGVEFGLSRLTQRGRWGWELSTLFAVGEVQRIVDLNGSTFINVPGVQQGTSPGGFFVGANQIGEFRDNDYAVIPQVRANVSYCLGANWRIRAGYDFFFLSSAFRPGSFINTNINGSTLASPAAPVGRTQPPTFRRSNLLLHGVTLGLSYNF